MPKTRFFDLFAVESGNDRKNLLDAAIFGRVYWVAGVELSPSAVGRHRDDVRPRGRTDFPMVVCGQRAGLYPHSSGSGRRCMYFP